MDIFTVTYSRINLTEKFHSALYGEVTKKEYKSLSKHMRVVSSETTITDETITTVSKFQNK